MMRSWIDGNLCAAMAYVCDETLIGDEDVDEGRTTNEKEADKRRTRST